MGATALSNSRFKNSEAIGSTGLTRPAKDAAGDYLHTDQTHTATHFRALEDRIAALEARSRADGGPTGEGRDDQAEVFWAIKHAARERAARQRFFPSEIISGEPCWDILLDLAAAQIEGKRVSVTSACLATDVPSTTALRWISVMESANLIERERDETDRRRAFLKLSSSCFEAIGNYFRYVLKGRR